MKEEIKKEIGKKPQASFNREPRGVGDSVPFAVDVL
jgi:hypothetical protein